ncbi:MAG: hypothetical protein IPM39_24880 [Chloroflexi bacterium]|nr:hypothetical protein [Chloroflexota bacterium]
MTQPTIENTKRIDVPKDMAPLIGHVFVPVILTPKQFHEFWEIVKRQETLKDDRHAIMQAYESRRVLVRQSHLYIGTEAVTLTPSGDDLADQAIAPFIVAATQDCVNRATRIPTLPDPSKTATE